LQNIGRRRYPVYWFSGTTAIVKDREKGVPVKESLDAAEMEAEEGRSRAMELDFLVEEMDEEAVVLDEQEGSRGDRVQGNGGLVRGRKFTKPY
jgi:hypothetical protein